jgi:hypothetical protein
MASSVCITLLPPNMRSILLSSTRSVQFGTQVCHPCICCGPILLHATTHHSIVLQSMGSMMLFTVQQAIQVRVPCCCPASKQVSKYEIRPCCFPVYILRTSMRSMLLFSTYIYTRFNNCPTCEINPYYFSQFMDQLYYRDQNMHDIHVAIQYTLSSTWDP